MESQIHGSNIKNRTRIGSIPIRNRKWIVCACVYVGTHTMVKPSLRSHTIECAFSYALLSTLLLLAQLLFVCVSSSTRQSMVYIRFFHCCFLSVAALNWDHSHEYHPPNNFTISFHETIISFILCLLSLWSNRQRKKTKFEHTQKKHSNLFKCLKCQRKELSADFSSKYVLYHI